MTGDDPYGLHALATRTQAALAMGGEQRIARQHAKGRLTARERIASLVDADSFDELGLLARSDMPEARDRTPADGKICGYGAVAGRPAPGGGADGTPRPDISGR